MVVRAVIPGGWPRICSEGFHALVLRRTFYCDLAGLHERAHAISGGARILDYFCRAERGALAGDSLGAAIEGLLLSKVGDAGSAEGARSQGRAEEGGGFCVRVLHEPAGGAE